MRVLFIFSIPFSTTALDGPQPPTAKGPVNIDVTNETFFLDYEIPVDTFVDREDGNTNSLSLHLFQSNGLEPEKSSWIRLTTAKHLVLCSTNAIYRAQPQAGYKYRLSALDSSGQEAHTDVNVRFLGPLLEPNYLRTIVRNLFTTNCCFSIL